MKTIEQALTDNSFHQAHNIGCDFCVTPDHYKTAHFTTLKNGKQICNYCKNHVRKQFKGIKQLKEDINLKEGEKIGVMVSGGKDGLYAWMTLCNIFGPENVIAFNHHKSGLVHPFAYENLLNASRILKSQLIIVEDNDFEEEEEETPVRGGASCAVDPVLYSMLKDLRKKLSKKLDVPPYVIFQDPSLEAMATIYPVTLEELQNIPGVGAGKAKRYGQEFCVLIKKHCEENEIERPEDLRVRTVANKSKLKVSIIQAIDRKVALDDIAVSKGLEFGELLDEVEAIVYSGTKLNIDYFLEEIMDEDHLNDIYDYFKESTTDKIDDAMDELGDDYTEDEIRLVRIKFISEMAN